MDVNMVGPWMICTMDVIVVGPWMLSSQNGIDNGRHSWAMEGHGCSVLRKKTMDVLTAGLSVRCMFSEGIRPWTSSCWAMHGCSVFRTH